MALFAAAPFLGPALGPITGGFLGQAAGWRWVEGFLAIFCGVMALVLFLFSPETYAPKLLRDRAERLSKATGQVYRFRSDAKSTLKLATVLKTSLIRPWQFLVYEPIVIVMTLYTAIVYGILYLNFEAYPIVFAVGHGFTAGETGLAFLGILVGVLMAVAISAVVINPLYLKTVKKRGYPTPEDRLPPVIAAGVLMVVALAGFAATCGPEIHWIAPIMFGIPFGLSMVLIFIGSLSYLVDTYSVYAASVLAANSVLRSLFGAAFPLFTTQMYEKLGIHWASALPGFLGLLCIPFTVLFYKYGATIRAKCRYAADAQRQLQAIMAARMATNKQDEEAQVGVTTRVGEEEVINNPAAMATATASSEMKAEVQGEKAATPSAAAHRNHPQHEWDEYGVLADRDMWDMNDEERLRLEELHRKFDHAKAKKH
jgi:MFS family permease